MCERVTRDGGVVTAGQGGEGRDNARSEGIWMQSRQMNARGIHCRSEA